VAGSVAARHGSTQIARGRQASATGCPTPYHVDWIQWDQAFTSVTSLGQDGEAGPRDVPLHPGAARWYREQGVEVS
jgi:hypothetical protein